MSHDPSWGNTWRITATDEEGQEHTAWLYNETEAHLCTHIWKEERGWTTTKITNTATPKLF